MEALVLKGGNAIDYLTRGNRSGLARTSYDLDFSMENEFDELEETKTLIKSSIERVFGEQGLVVIDYKFHEKPSVPQEMTKDFWGGYNIEFKIVTQGDFDAAKGDLTKLRNSAFAGYAGGSSKVIIEISKFEYVGDRQTADLEGLVFYIYSPEMMVFEKVRALCQQLPKYADIIPSHHPRPRARDFFDIYGIMDQFKIDPSAPESTYLLKRIFAAKKVPLSFIKDIPDHLEIHRQDWQNVLDTISAMEEVEGFDFYVDFVMKRFGDLIFP